ncbi:MAG TPA: permease prefix domain 1-containing protein [Candidatus Nanopelagicales bacterium]|nr:permease prefix domain 1-containing protein [Candidatus Nanopelagicales bacterium]
MSTLTDRYVWGVLRAVPAAQRTDLEPEVRAMIADAMEARIAAGVVPDEAERAAVAELGDPERLAARYTDRSLVLIGPAYFPDWKRLLTLLLTIVVPITAIAVIGAGSLAGKTVGELVLDGAGTAFMVGVQLSFWITLVFAFLERSGQPPLGEAWTPDQLPDVPSARKGGVNPVELAFSVVALVVAAGALVWQQTATPITIDGTGYPLFDPVLWSFWLPWFLVILGLEITFTFARWRAGGWTWVLAGVNLVLNIAFMVPAVWLLQNGLLLDSGLMAEIDRMSGSAWLQPTLAVTTVILVAVGAWDSFDGFRQAYQNQPTRSR